MSPIGTSLQNQRSDFMFGFGVDRTCPNGKDDAIDPKRTSIRPKTTCLTADIGYRAIISTPTTVIGFRTAAGRHAGVPFSEGYSGLADREWLADRDLTLWPFIVIAILLAHR